MTISPTPFAASIADQLARVLQAIRVQYGDQIAPALAAAVDHRHFAPARQIIADADHIANEVERILTAGGLVVDRLSGAVGELVYDLIDTGEITGVLDDIDPERLANEDRIVDGLRASGNWSDTEEAARQRDNADRAASYPVLQQ